MSTSSLTPTPVSSKASLWDNGLTNTLIDTASEASKVLDAPTLQSGPIPLTCARDVEVIIHVILADPVKAKNFFKIGNHVLFLCEGVRFDQDEAFFLALRGLAGIVAWWRSSSEKWLRFSRCSFVGVNLSNMDLSNVAFVESNLSKVRIINSDLWFTTYDAVTMDGAMLFGTNLHGAHFSKQCSLKNAFFVDIKLSRAIFMQADLSEISFTRVYLGDVYFGTSTLRGARFHDCFHMDRSDLANSADLDTIVGVDESVLKYRPKQA